MADGCVLTSQTALVTLSLQKCSKQSNVQLICQTKGDVHTSHILFFLFNTNNENAKYDTKIYNVTSNHYFLLIANWKSNGDHFLCSTIENWAIKDNISIRCCFFVFFFTTSMTENLLLELFKIKVSSVRWFHCKARLLCAPSQWETTLHCNVVSHWLGTDTKRPLSL